MAVPYNNHHRGFILPENWINRVFTSVRGLMNMITHGNKYGITSRRDYQKKKQRLEILATSLINGQCKKRIIDELISAFKHGGEDAAKKLWNQYKMVLTDPNLDVAEKEVFIVALSKGSAYINSRKEKDKLATEAEGSSNKLQDGISVSTEDKNHPSAVLDCSATKVLMELQQLSLTADDMPLANHKLGVNKLQTLFGLHKHHLEHPGVSTPSFPRVVMESQQSGKEELSILHSACSKQRHS